MRIPESWTDANGNWLSYYERLEAPLTRKVTIQDHELVIISEPPREKRVFGCTPEDVIRVLSVVAPFVPVLPDIVAFRHPTRKQAQQNPVWARCVYFAEIAGYDGRAIVLEAQGLGEELRWPVQMSLEDRAEFERLVQDGYSFRQTRRHNVAKITAPAFRNTQLFRSLLHELGHLVDYHEKVLDPETTLDPDEDLARDLYFARPVREREEFAHRFAAELGQRLRKAGAIPFPPQQQATEPG